MPNSDEMAQITRDHNEQHPHECGDRIANTERAQDRVDGPEAETHQNKCDE